MTPVPAAPRVRRRRVRPVVAGLLAVATALIGFELPSQATAPTQAPLVSGRPCAAAAGVTVEVDFASTASDHVVLGCAVGAQPNGLAALAHAGFSTVDVPNFPSGAVCQINGKPTQGYPYCWTTGGYWAYWRSDGKQPWTLSSVGAGQTGRIPVGRVEGWRFTLLTEPFPTPAPSVAVADIPNGGLRAPSVTSVRRLTPPVGVFGRRARIVVSVMSAVPTVGRVSVSVGRRTLARARTRHGTALLVLRARSLWPGRHLLTVTYHGSASVAPSRTHVRWTVRKGRAHLRVRREPTRVTTATRLRLIVTVRAIGLRPSGRVRVVRHGTVLAAAHTRHGRAVLRLPRFHRPGKVRLRVVFAGSPTVRRAVREYAVAVAR
jgi:hypothetical protein